MAQRLGGWVSGLAMLLALRAGAQNVKEITVGPAGSSPAADFATVQEAVNAAPDAGATIRLYPGTYREVVHIDKPNVRLIGEPKAPEKVVVTFDNGASSTCGTFCSPTMFVTGDGFVMDGITVANEWSKTGKPRTQAVALSITSDRAVLRNIRLLGAQDTLYAASKSCKADPATCKVSRQYFDRCTIVGEVDFIFGNSRAVFHDCEIRSIVHEAGSFLTAHSRNSVAEDSGYVFDHCRVTAEPGVEHVFLGRPWRAYATVAFIESDLGAHIMPEGWSEWHEGETDRLKTATYAEYNSKGPGANPSAREPFSKQLTATEAKKYVARSYLAGSDAWDPTLMK